MAASLTIEATQYITNYFLGSGHVADVNDLVCNVVGAAIGAGLFSVVSRVPGADALIDRFRWAEPHPSPRVEGEGQQVDRR